MEGASIRIAKDDETLVKTNSNGSFAIEVEAFPFVFVLLADNIYIYIPPCSNDFLRRLPL